MPASGKHNAYSFTRETYSAVRVSIRSTSSSSTKSESANCRTQEGPHSSYTTNDLKEENDRSTMNEAMEESPVPCDTSSCIAGAIITQCVQTLNAENSEFIGNPQKYSQLVYILTLGTRKEFRGRGIASMLIQKCVEEAKKDAKYGAVFLHVKEHNHQGRRLYETNGFFNVKLIKGWTPLTWLLLSCVFSLIL